ncbi:DUF2778 domain-containing protein [Microvirga puerhi]|uniref:DUF2778 domain-containing protein n=1 Tax=Microvirga puerhi TaxID=2876078 RepID=A0ABS7VIL2_9HYPH|nr:DUF2778 domain-containing protein [Microvirga puerhi]MBZ6074857.1 DUF2778 domain-containing protein [Microvirga puerhi]
MVHNVYPSGGRARRRNRSPHLLTAIFLAALASPVAFLIDRPAREEAPDASNVAVPMATHQPAATPSIVIYDQAFIDPAPILAPGARDFSHNAPLSATFRAPPTLQEASLAPSAQPISEEPVLPLPPLPPLRTAQTLQPVPLPVPRPVDLRAPKPVAALQVASAAPPTATSAATPTTPPSNPSLIEKLFGIKPASPPPSALSYAALENGTGSIAPSARFGSNPGAVPSDGTAVYDISAKVVVMPNGERLEAHSGLGDKLDDPRYVHVRMRGPTPPGTYVLTEREQLFHGVRALRMNPVGGSSAIHGRDGILAHTYMLGPNGDSNGCISFRNYDRFLQAYLRGEVRRIVVVTGYKQDTLPRIVNNRAGTRRDG